MNIIEMTQTLQELVDDPEKASIVFSAILKSENSDLIQRTMELYVLLILNHGEEIQKAFNKEHNKQEEYQQIIDRLTRELEDKDRGWNEDQIKRKRERIHDWHDYHKKIFDSKSSTTFLKNKKYILEE